MKKLFSQKANIYCRILFLLSFSILFISCLSWIVEKPTFAIRGLTLKQISLKEVNVIFDLDVQNPNSFDLTLQTFEYTVYLKNEEIGNGRMEKELLIPSSSTTRIQVPVVAKFKDWSRSLKTILTEGDLLYKIEGNTDVKTVFGSRKFPFSKEGSIN